MGGDRQPLAFGGDGLADFARRPPRSRPSILAATSTTRCTVEWLTDSKLVRGAIVAMSPSRMTGAAGSEAGDTLDRSGRLTGIAIRSATLLIRLIGSITATL